MNHEPLSGIEFACKAIIGGAVTGLVTWALASANVSPYIVLPLAVVVAFLFAVWATAGLE